MPPKRCPNRLLVLCASINDVTAWPFWKFLQMKKIRGVTDMALLAFNSDGGSFEARIDGEKYQLKNYAKVRGYQQDMLESFLQRWHDPGRSYFIYGGHGMGDYLELEQDRVALQAHSLAALFGSRRFEAVLFDACFMANLDCAYYLRHHTRYIGACEGYMWEPDTALDYHIFNTHNASAMSRFKDPLRILRTISADYCSKAARGDFSIIDTTHVAALRQFVQEHVIQRVYNRATMYDRLQLERLSAMAEAASHAAIAAYGHPGGKQHQMDSESLFGARLRTGAPLSEAGVVSQVGRRSKQQRIQHAVQFEHSLYPSEIGDKQLLDLKSYLLDMAAEAKVGQSAASSAAAAKPGTARPSRRRSDGSPPRTLCVANHGSYPGIHPMDVALSPATLPLPSTSVTTTTTTAEAAAGMPPSAAGAPAETTPSSPLQVAQRGLDLFRKVVVHHSAPKASNVYAARLGGLSLTVHEFHGMSRPVEPWICSKRRLREKAKQFLKHGTLSEVQMEATAACGSTADANALITRPRDHHHHHHHAIATVLPAVGPGAPAASTPAPSSSATLPSAESVWAADRTGGAAASATSGNGTAETRKREVEHLKTVQLNWTSSTSLPPPASPPPPLCSTICKEMS